MSSYFQTCVQGGLWKHLEETDKDMPESDSHEVGKPGVRIVWHVGWRVPASYPVYPGAAVDIAPSPSRLANSGAWAVRGPLVL